MRVKIVRAEEHCWYNVGEEYEVRAFNITMYVVVKNGKNTYRLIPVSDCEQAKVIEVDMSDKITFMCSECDRSDPCYSLLSTLYDDNHPYTCHYGRDEKVVKWKKVGVVFTNQLSQR